MSYTKLCLALKSLLAISLFTLGANVHSVQPVSVSASDFQAGNIPDNTVDGDMDTRWSASGDGQWILYDLGGSFLIDDVEIALLRGDERTAFLQVQLSDDGLTWDTVWDGAQPRRTSGLQTFELDDTYASYVRLVGFGNTVNSWNSYNEVVINDLGRGGDPTPTPTPSPTVTPEPTTCDDPSVSASSFQAGNNPDRVLDNDLDTRWSAEGADGSEWLQIDCGASMTLYGIDIAFHKGDERTANFSVQFSDDGVIWQQDISNALGGGDSDEFQAFAFDQSVNARYLRYVGYGNSVNNWNSLTEVRAIDSPIIIPTPSPTPTPLVTPTPSPSPSPTPIPTPSPTPTPGACDVDLLGWGMTFPDGESLNKKEHIQRYFVDKANRGEDVCGGSRDWLSIDNEGCVTFTSPPNDDSDSCAGSSDTSSYLRSELRQLITEWEDDDVDASGYTKNNWVTSKASSSLQERVGGVNGNMTATLVVNEVSVTATDWVQLGTVIVGQIHGSEDEPVKIYYRKLPEHTYGSIWITVDNSSGDPSDRITFFGFNDKAKEDRRDELEPVENGIALGQPFSYEIDLTGDQLSVTISHSGKTFTMADAIRYSKEYMTQEVTGSSLSYIQRDSGDTEAITLGSHFDDDWMYFKAGVYNQNNTGDGREAASATFYQLEYTHD